MEKGILLVISGPAGSGKGTVVKEIFARSDDFAYSVSATTRDPRPGEEDGINYHFITKEKFEENIREDRVIEYTSYCGNYYGTLKSELKKLDSGKNLILEIEVEGALNIKRLYPDCVTLFILPPDYETLKARLIGRGTNTEEDIKNRLKKALSEIENIPKYDYFVRNEDGLCGKAAEDIIGIVKAEKHKSFRNAKNVIENFTK